MGLRKLTYPVVFILLIHNVCLSQNWVWKHQTDSANRKGFYGTQGIGTSLTRPGARNMAVTWSDSLGNLWMFGGTGYASTNTSGELSDLWKYNPTSDTWTWIRGSAIVNQYGGYVTKGMPHPAAQPGTRHSPIVWKDKSGNFWLFGGVGYAQTGPIGGMNDLWKYDPSTNLWTWVNGPQLTGQPPSYGTQGVASPSNIPGPRSDGAGWVDPVTGDLWMFGGNALGTTGGGPINDLWKYNIATDRWTWMKGPTITYQNGTYGTMGVAAPANNPGSRFWCNSFIDASGNFYLFGGEGYASVASAFGIMNDVWKFDIATNNWTWIKGSNLVNQPANFGSLGVSSPSNTPAGKYRAIGWTDSLNNFWSFGGYDQNNWKWNDLWKYDVATNEWVWLSGSNTLNQWGVYGTMNIPSASNVPGGRASPSSWTAKDGSLWLFGGTGNSSMINGSGLLNDLWKLVPSITTSISEYGNEEVNVYPNPTSDQLIIQAGKTKILKCELIDMSGKIVFEGEVNEFNTNINIQSIKSGLYTLRIISSLGTQTRKLSLINN